MAFTDAPRGTKPRTGRTRGCWFLAALPQYMPVAKTNLDSSRVNLWVHPGCPSSFRHQKTAHVPVSPLLTAVPSFPETKACREGVNPRPSRLAVVRNETKLRVGAFVVASCPAPPVSTRTVPLLPCSVTADLPVSPTCTTLVRLWRLNHLPDEVSTEGPPRQPKSLPN